MTSPVGGVEEVDKSGVVHFRTLVKLTLTLTLTLP